MSSHHFVKEGQEPALFIINPISFNHVQLLLEWAPLVVVADTALDGILLWGIKIDVVLAKATHVEKIAEKISMQAPVQIVRYGDNEDMVQTGLQFLITNRQHTVTLISGGEDNVFASLENFSDTLKIVLLNETTKWSFIPVKHFKKWIAGGSILSVRRTEQTQQFSIQGLTELPTGSLKASNDGLVTIESLYPFWIGEGL